MPQGDPGGNFAGTAGYGGQFGGFGGASAGYSGGYGNPSSTGGGTAGQTYAGQQYANSLNKHNPTLANYSGVGANAPGNAASAAAAYVAARKRRAAAVTPPTVTPPTTPVPPEEWDVSPLPPTPNPNAVNPATGIPNGTYPQSQYSGYGSYPTYFGGHPAPPDPATGPGSGWSGMLNDAGSVLGHAWEGFGGMLHDGIAAAGNAITGQNRRQFGGPVGPGQTYTVGENGPETLQMGPGGGGQVIPHNPMDRLGGMNPQMMQQLFQMQRQFGGAGRQGMDGQPPASPQPMPPAGGSGNYQPGMTPPATMPPAPPRPAMGGGGSYGQPQQPAAQPPAPPTLPPQGGSGGWQNRMGIEGLSRPMRPPQGGAGGFGLSGLGQPGVMGQLRRQGGFGGR